MHLRWFLAVVVWWAFAAVAHAEPPKLRATIATQVGTTANVHERVSVSAGVGGQFLMRGAAPNDRAGALADLGVSVFAHEILTVTAGYHYGYGTFTWDSPGHQEHRGTVGLRISTRGRRVYFVNRTDLDLRGLELFGGWRFDVRFREEMRLTAVFHRAVNMSVFSEIMVHPRNPWRDVVQLRPGLAVHGEIPLARRAAPDEGAPGARKRRDVALFRFLGQQVGLFPVALALPPRETNELDILSLMTADHATTLELRTTVSLSVLW